MTPGKTLDSERLCGLQMSAVDYSATAAVWVLGLEMTQMVRHPKRDGNEDHFMWSCRNASSRENYPLEVVGARSREFVKLAEAADKSGWIAPGPVRAWLTVLEGWTAVLYALGGVDGAGVLAVGWFDSGDEPLQVVRVPPGVLDQTSDVSPRFWHDLARNVLAANGHAVDAVTQID